MSSRAYPGTRKPVLTAYFDESVTPLVFTGAGYIATKTQWVHFEREWLKILKWADIPDGEPFHMVAFENRAHGTVYEHWSDDKRKQFMQRAIAVIRRRVKVGISASLDLPAYNRLLADPVRAEGFAGAPQASFSPYSFALGLCLKIVEYWCDKNRRNDPTDYVFESGGALSGHLENVLQRMEKDDDLRQRYRLGSWRFESKYDRIPLQCADIIAYESSKHWTNFIRFNKSSKRPSLKNLMTIRTIDRYFNESDLRDYLGYLEAKNRKPRLRALKKLRDKGFKRRKK